MTILFTNLITKNRKKQLLASRDTFIATGLGGLTDIIVRVFSDSYVKKILLLTEEKGSKGQQYKDGKQQY